MRKTKDSKHQKPKCGVARRLKPFRYNLNVALLVAATAAGVCRIEAYSRTDTQPIRVGVLVDNYPFSYRDKDGRMKGFAYELVKEIEQLADLRFERVEGTTEQIYKLFQEGKIDLMQNYIQSPERELIAEFSVPYITMTGQVFVGKHVQGVKRLLDLKGRKILVHRSSLGEKLFKDASLGDNITYVESVERALVMINRAEGDATFTGRLTGLAIARRLGLKNVRPLDIEVKEHELRCCVAVRKGDHHLLAHVNEALAILMRTGKFDKLYQKWFGSVTPHRYTKEQFLGAVAVGLAIALGVTIWAIIRQHRLTAQIKRQAEAVRESERKYRTLFETANDAIFLLREDKFVDCNAGASLMFGCAREKLIGARPFEFSPPTQPDGRPSEEKALEKIKAAYSQGPQFFEWEHQRADGSRFMTEVSLNRLETGTEALLLAIVRDITVRKRAEAALAESEAMFRALAETTAAAIVVYQGTRFKFANPACERLTGYTQAELGEIDFWEVVHPEHRALVKQRGLARQRGEPVPRRYEFKILTKNGEERWVDFSAGSIIFKGQPAGLATALDITERKRAELALRESEERYRLLYESMMDAFVSTTMDGRIREFNPAYREMLGYSEDELKQLTYMDLTPPKWHAFEARIVQEQVLQRGYSDVYEKEYRKKDGTVFPVELRAFLIRDAAAQPVGMWAIVRDITERKRAEAALRESEERFRLLAESSLVGIYLFQDNRFVYVNPALAAIFGHTVDEIVGKLSPLDLTHPDDRDLVQQNIQRRTQEGVQSLHYEFRGLRKDGTVIHLESHGGRLDYRNRPAILGTLVDITERKRIEEALRRSEQRYRDMLELAPSAILVHDMTGRLIEVNKRACESLGYTRAELLGRYIWEIDPQAIQTGKDKLWESVLAGQQITFQSNHVRKDGTLLPVEITLGSMHLDQGPAIFGVVQDITERLRAEAALHALTARLQEVREEESKRIARELHDELGQVLTALKMDLHWVERDLEGKKPTKRTNALLEKIMGASELVDSAIKTVQRICAELRPTLLDKLGLVETLKYEARQFEERTRIKCRLHTPEPEPELPNDVAIACYRICQEALTNVARHAKATAVEIALRLESTLHQNNAGTAKCNSETLVLEIRDNGCGIPPAKLTDPQSLGLIGMQERARALGGTLRVRPGPDGGTIVTLSIPRTANIKTTAYESTDSRRPRNRQARVTRSVGKGIRRS